MKELTFHLASEIFELLEGADFQSLVNDIRKHGLLNPIWLHPDGSILDGRNRYRACLEAEVEPLFQTWNGDGSAADFVWSLNFTRRHLEGNARKIAAAKYAIELEREARDRQLSGLRNVGSLGQTCPNDESGRSKEIAADKFNESPRSVQSAVTIVKHGVPELLTAVEHGDVSVSAAAEVARLPEPEQREIVARGEKEIISTANKLKAEKKAAKQAERRAEVAILASGISTCSSRIDLYKEPCINALSGDAETVDWVITDPPYPREFLGVYDDLGLVAAHALKPGGSLICMIGQSYVPDIIAALSKHLTYHWTLAYLTPGGQATQLFPRKVNTFWKPVLWFVKGEYDGDWIGDVSRSKPNDNDKRFHEWGQSESGMRDLMERFVRPGDTVMDPFMGAGTTGVIALELGAKFFGFDPDENAFNEASVRIDRADLVA